MLALGMQAFAHRHCVAAYPSMKIHIYCSAALATCVKSEELRPTQCTAAIMGNRLTASHSRSNSRSNSCLVTLHSLWLTHTHTHSYALQREALQLLAANSCSEQQLGAVSLAQKIHTKLRQLRKHTLAHATVMRAAHPSTHTLSGYITSSYTHL